MFLVLVSGVNAFTLNNVPDQTWNEKYPWELSANLSTFIVLPAGETFTYSVKSQTGTDIVISNVNTGLPTFTVADEDWTGSNDVVFTITGSVSGSKDTNVIKLTRNVPAYCSLEDYGATKIAIGDIDFDDETYKIGDTVTVTIEDVEALNEDLEDVETKVYLYNVGQKVEVMDWNIDENFDINDGDKEDFELEFKIPNSEDIGKSDIYRLVVYVTGDIESGDQRCVQGSEDIEIERETHDVIVSDVTLSPSIAKAGETVQVTVKVENIGTKDETDVYVKLKEDLLKIDLESSKFDLDNYKDSDNTNTVRFTITIPEDAKIQDYQDLEAIVYFDDGDETNGKFATTLKVESSVIAPKKAPFEITTADTKIDATKGKSASIQLIITSNDANDVDATVELSTIGNWADAIAPQSVSLHNGENNIYLPLTLKDVTAGMHTATVTIKPVGQSNFDVKQSTLSFEVIGEVKEATTTPVTGLTTAVGGFKGSSLFWIIGDVVLVIIALFFIKAIFFGKKD